MGRKNKYTKDIKVKAIKEYLAGKKSIREISNELDCNKSVLRRWIVLYKECGSQIFEDKVSICTDCNICKLYNLNLTM